MPYIVTTKRPDPTLFAEVMRFERETRQEERAPAIRGDQRVAYLMREGLKRRRDKLAESVVVSRRAVATLEEVAIYLTDEKGYSTTTRDVEEELHSGGTVGPLPDGTVIKVSDDLPIAEIAKGTADPDHWLILIARHRGPVPDRSDLATQIYTAYNAKQAGQ